MIITTVFANKRTLHIYIYNLPILSSIYTRFGLDFASLLILYANINDNIHKLPHQQFPPNLSELAGVLIHGIHRAKAVLLHLTEAQIRCLNPQKMCFQVRFNSIFPQNAVYLNNLQQFSREILEIAKCKQMHQNC